jgi:cation:H+ antiporter
MSAASQAWSQFFVCLVVIAVAGARLVHYGDSLAALTGLSRNWIGLVLVATVTSLPELVTGLSAVTIAAAPDIAIGDALGSCVFNLLTLSIADLLHRRGAIYAQASSVHVLSAAFGVVLLGVAGLTILMPAPFQVPALGHVGAGSMVLVVLYLFAMRTIFRQEPRASPVAPQDTRAGMSLRQALAGYAFTAAAIVAAGIWLPMIGVQLATAMGWSNSFVGTLFVAFATSAPELATTLAALRIGAIDLAFGNLLGSNLFDLLIVAIDDIAYLPGPIFAAVAPTHAISALVASVMSGAVIVALVCRPATRVLGTMSWVSISLVGLYLTNALIQYRHAQ